MDPCTYHYQGDPTTGPCYQQCPSPDGQGRTITPLTPAQCTQLRATPVVQLTPGALPLQLQIGTPQNLALTQRPPQPLPLYQQSAPTAILAAMPSGAAPSPGAAASPSCCPCPQASPYAGAFRPPPPRPGMPPIK